MGNGCSRAGKNQLVVFNLLSRRQEEAVTKRRLQVDGDFCVYPMFCCGGGGHIDRLKGGRFPRLISRVKLFLKEAS